jgi:hypothetical protein
MVIAELSAKDGRRCSTRVSWDARREDIRAHTIQPDMLKERIRDEVLAEALPL